MAMSRRLRKNGMQGCECCLLPVGLNQVYSCVSFDAVFLVTAVVASKWSLCAVAAVYSLHTLVVQDRCSTVLVPIMCLLLKKTLLQLFSCENPSASLLLAALATVLLLTFATFFLTLHLSSWKTYLFREKKRNRKLLYSFPHMYRQQLWHTICILRQKCALSLNKCLHLLHLHIYFCRYTIYYAYAHY